MTLSPKERKNSCKGCILVNRIKKFFVSTFLSGMCLMFSAPVLAGNGQSGNQITVNDISIRLDFIERKILFETTTQILNELNLIFMFLKTMEAKLSFDQKSLILEQIKNVLYKPEFSYKVKNSDLTDRKLYDNLSCRVSDVASEKAPSTPRIMPKKFMGEVDEWFWLSSIGSEELTRFWV